MSRKDDISPSIPAFTLACLLPLIACCTSEHNDQVIPSGNGTVAFYVTDAPSAYQQASLSVAKAELINSGTRQTCSLIDSPVVTDVARLSGVMELVATSECPAGEYNRIHLELDERLYLSDSVRSSSCRLAYLLDRDGHPEPLACDGSGKCSLDLATAVRRPSLSLPAGQTTPLAVDFQLGDFLVDGFGDPASCTVSMKASALQLSAIVQRHDFLSVPGRVAGLDAAARTFTLRSGHRPLVVDYRSISESVQPGIGMLLQMAQDERFRVWVKTEQIDVEEHVLIASGLMVRIKGTASAIDPVAKTCLLTFKPPDRSVTVEYGPPALVAGGPVNTAPIEAILYAYDAATDRYRASIIAPDSGNDPDN